MGITQFYALNALNDAKAKRILDTIKKVRFI